MRSFFVMVIVLTSSYITACSDSADSEVPRGYYSQLELTTDGKQLTFGPFVGYYFKPVEGDHLDHLEFICYNERGFYTDELPVNALLFRGEAKRTNLPGNISIPKASQRINPIFFDKAPQEWLATRPQPPSDYLHFHSTYSAQGASHTGYWLRHEPVTTFTYNMGGRISESSPLYHRAETGNSLNFPRILEFDYGPDWTH